jgi:opacity protein-like surface antigen
MKKIILTLAVVLTAAFANAQDMKFGAKGGLNSFTVTNSTGAKSKISFQLGGFAEFKVSEKFAVQPELMYTSQGAKDAFGTLALSYINIPVIAKYYVTEDFSIQAGPQIGFLMSAKYDGTDVKDSLKSMDYGLNIGAGYNLNEDMMLDLRYYLGMAQLQKDLATGESASHNAGILLSFGYKF